MSGDQNGNTVPEFKPEPVEAMDPQCPELIQQGRMAERFAPSTWDRGHWTPGQRIPCHSKHHSDGTVEVKSWQIGWPADWPVPPLTCSFCGGAKPRDILRLMSVDGWEVEATSKFYKLYLHPPGHRERVQAVISALDGKSPLEVGKALEMDGTSEENAREVSSPVPPVKAYIYHFTYEETRRFNQILKEREENAGK